MSDVEVIAILSRVLVSFLVVLFEAYRAETQGFHLKAWDKNNSKVDLIRFVENYRRVAGLSNVPLPGLGKNRRINKDHDALLQGSESFIYVPSIHVLVRRLVRASCF